MTEREQEDLLRESLRRVRPPDGFADRVMARLPRQPWWSRILVPARRAAWVPALATLLVTFMAAGSWEYAQWRDRRLRAERAHEELVQALEITTEKVQETKARLFRPRSMRGIL